MFVNFFYPLARQNKLSWINEKKKNVKSDPNFFYEQNTVCVVFDKSRMDGKTFICLGKHKFKKYINICSLIKSHTQNYKHFRNTFHFLFKHRNQQRNQKKSL